ncbi:MAG: hypothetical protein ACOYK8_06900 [Alphaproteobacteria bacterium]
MKSLRNLTAALLLSVAIIPAALAQTATDGNNNNQLSEGDLSTLTALIGSKTDTPSFTLGDRTSDASIGGAAASGAVAGGNLKVQSKTSTKLDLTGSAQASAEALNLDNSVNSTIANASNLQVGGLANQAFGGLVPFVVNGAFGLDQSNGISQNQADGAVLGGYQALAAAGTSSGSYSRTLSTKGSVDTEMDVLGQKAHLGSGGAGAGTFKLDIGSAGISFSPELTTSASAVFGLVSGEVTAKAPLSLNLPTVGLDIDGAGCGTVGGSCSASGDDKIDQSSSAGIDSAPVLTVKDVAADYISVGDSDINLNTTSSLSLSDNVQEKAKGINIANAVDSQVANALNVGVTGGLSVGNGVVGLVRQTNVVVQRR